MSRPPSRPRRVPVLVLRCQWARAVATHPGCTLWSPVPAGMAQGWLLSVGTALEQLVQNPYQSASLAHPRCTGSGGLPWPHCPFCWFSRPMGTQENIHAPSLGRNHHFDFMWPLGSGANVALCSPAALGPALTPVLSPSVQPWGQTLQLCLLG